MEPNSLSYKLTRTSSCLWIHTSNNLEIHTDERQKLEKQAQTRAEKHPPPRGFRMGQAGESGEQHHSITASQQQAELAFA
jgi:hypothetical protein